MNLEVPVFPLNLMYIVLSSLMIFVSLENKMHQILNDRRVNKVNLRKEFFKISIDELETLVEEIDPSAEFNKTMIAEEFRQSISSDEVYSSDYSLDDDPEDE